MSSKGCSSTAVRGDERTLYGAFTPSDWVEHFTMGQCHSLALSIHYMTKWPIVILCDQTEQWYYDDKGCCCHAIISHPSGLVLDITGLRPFEDVWQEWRDEWDLNYWFTALPEAFDVWETPLMDVSDPVAERIIAHTNRNPEGWTLWT